MKEQPILLGAVVVQAAVTCAFLKSSNTRDHKLQKFMVDNFTTNRTGVLREGRYHTLITSVFTHINPVQLAVNTVAMYSFGTNTMAFLGPARFIALYMGGGLVSSLAFVVWPSMISKSWPVRSTYDTDPSYYGATGALNALITWSALKQPFNKFLLMGILPLPAFVCGLGLVGYDAYCLYDGSGGVANASHLCGAAFGALFFKFTRKFHYF